MGITVACSHASSQLLTHCRLKDTRAIHRLLRDDILLRRLFSPSLSLSLYRALSSLVAECASVRVAECARKVVLVL